MNSSSSTTSPGQNGFIGSGSSNPGNSGSGGSNNSNGNSLTWHEPWSEQVWADTSSWQSVYIGDNPIYETHHICSDCGAIVDYVGAEHLLSTGHSGYRTETILVGYTPIYENRWVESGYWTTVTHPGYWG